MVFPRGKDIVAFALEPANAQGCAEMVKDQRGVRHRAGKVQKLLVLMMVMPAVQGQPPFAQDRSPADEIGVAILVRHTAPGNGKVLRFGVTGTGIADPFEQSLPRLLMRIQCLVQQGRSTIPQWACQSTHNSLALTPANCGDDPNHPLSLQ